MCRPKDACRVRHPAAHLIIVISLLAGCATMARAQTEAERLFKEAQEARSQGNLALAEQKYQKVTRLAPNLARAYHNLGIVYFMERKYADAATALDRAVAIEPRLPGAQAMRGLCYYELYQPQKAIPAFQAAVRINPADKHALLYLGKSQIQAHNYRAAANTLEKLAEEPPSADPDVFYNLSLAYIKLMLESVRRLGQVAPASYQFWLLLAQDGEARGDEQAAIRNYQQALRVKPDAVGVHYGLGSVYAKVGKYDDAAEELKKELQINSNDSLALWKLGELALRTDPEQARKYLERAVSLDPDFPQAVLAYGRALARAGELEKATEQFRRVVRLAPEEDSVHYHLANAYRRLGRDEEAKKELARFEELAKQKDERTQQTARRLIEMTRAAQPVTDEPEPGFLSSRDPTHQ
jgi:tetratricopeptide (TPR) repeat protein